MKKSKFNLSHMNSTTLDAGKLVPFCVIPTLPNDTFHIGNKSFIRATPMLAPLMHRVFLFSQYWYVPYRLLWKNWEEFITGGPDLLSAPAFPTIKAPAAGWEVGSLADYLGFPTGQGEIEHSAMPFRAVAEIWNTRYRDEDLQNEISISYDDGLDTTTSTELLSPCWKRDKYTKSRLSTQRGGEISVPIDPAISGGANTFYHFTIEVETYGANRWMTYYAYPSKPYYTPSNTSTTSITLKSWLETPENFNKIMALEVGEMFEPDNLFLYFARDKHWNPARIILKSKEQEVYTNQVLNQFVGNTEIYQVAAERFQQPPIVYHSSLLQSTGSLDIRNLRLAAALQRYQERSLKWGNRYEEFIQNKFGCKPKDARIDRPEYLGGSKSLMNISEVLQTAEGTDNGVGTMRGHGIGSLQNRRIRFTSPEHGVIIGFMSIRPEPVYTQGIEKEWLKKSRLEFFTPELADVGMQEIMQQELFATKDNSTMIFGYTDKYSEYRYMPPKISGEFKTVYDYWNMARFFEAPPSLNGDFVDMASSEASFKRPFAEKTMHNFLAMLRNDIVAYRVVPKSARNILK